MWVRGLKLQTELTRTFHLASHPMWVRGLKQPQFEGAPFVTKVAPHVGAWIETGYPIA